MTNPSVAKLMDSAKRAAEARVNYTNHVGGRKYTGEIYLSELSPDACVTLLNMEYKTPRGTHIRGNDSVRAEAVFTTPLLSDGIPDPKFQYRSKV